MNVPNIPGNSGDLLEVFWLLEILEIYWKFAKSRKLSDGV